MSGGKQTFIKSKKFSDQSFDSVSFYGISRFLGYGKSQPSNPLRITACYNRKVLRTSPHPLLINSFISVSSVNPFRFPVRLFFHAYRRQSFKQIKRLNVFFLWIFCGLKPAFRILKPYERETRGSFFFWYLFCLLKSFSWLIL